MTASFELEDLGILRQTKLPESLSWLTELEKFIMLELLLCGEEGMHKRRVEKHDKQEPGCILRLDAHGLAQWERDKVGRPMFFTLTWRGDEVAQLLRKVALHATEKPRYLAGADKAAG